MHEITFKILCADNTIACKNVLDTMRNEGFKMKNSKGYDYDYFGKQTFPTIMAADEKAERITNQVGSDLLTLDLHME